MYRCPGGQFSSAYGLRGFERGGDNLLGQDVVPREGDRKSRMLRSLRTGWCRDGGVVVLVSKRLEGMYWSAGRPFAGAKRIWTWSIEGFDDWIEERSGYGQMGSEGFEGWWLVRYLALRVTEFFRGRILGVRITEEGSEGAQAAQTSLFEVWLLGGMGFGSAELVEVKSGELVRLFGFEVGPKRVRSGGPNTGEEGEGAPSSAKGIVRDPGGCTRIGTKPKSVWLCIPSSSTEPREVVM
ncbi:hypothetical protein DFH11DRAFT_1549782 [Phellopilus nigrolimitatus]|nr:hypothetical protein DFH11DRAFT_1549782 [Phellopilus nigrolimitatus]